MKKERQKNYLDNIPVKNPKINWEIDDNGMVTLIRHNKGIANKLAQIILRKPKVSYIHLDETGSCVWPKIDGEKNIFELAEYVKEKFGDKAEPLYERIAKYFSVLQGCGFVSFRK